MRSLFSFFLSGYSLYFSIPLLLLQIISSSKCSINNSSTKYAHLFSFFVPILLDTMVFYSSYVSFTSKDQENKREPVKKNIYNFTPYGQLLFDYTNTVSLPFLYIFSLRYSHNFFYFLFPSTTLFYSHFLPNYPTLLYLFLFLLASFLLLQCFLQSLPDFHENVSHLIGSTFNSHVHSSSISLSNTLITSSLRPFHTSLARHQLLVWSLYDFSFLYICCT